MIKSNRSNGLDEARIGQPASDLLTRVEFGIRFDNCRGDAMRRPISDPLTRVILKKLGGCADRAKPAGSRRSQAKQFVKAGLVLIGLLLLSTGLCVDAQAAKGKAPAKKGGGGGGGAPYPQCLYQGGKVARSIPQFMPLKICISPGICLDGAGTDPDTGGPLSNVDNVARWPELVYQTKNNPELFNNLPQAEGYTDQMWQAAAQGINSWKRFQNEGLFSFEVTDNPEGADVYVFWTNHFVNKLGLGLFANDIRGYTSKHLLPYGAVANALNSGNSDLIKRSRRPIVMILRTTDLTGAQSIPIPLGKLVSASAHEMGHVLGIDGHSLNRSDLMSVNYGNGAISANDAATIRYLYHRNVDFLP